MRAHPPATFLLIGILAFACQAAAQANPDRTPTLEKPEASRPAPQIAPGVSGTAKRTEPESFQPTDGRFLALPKQILRDQGAFWTLPLNLKRPDLKWTAGAAGVTALTFAVDEPMVEAIGFREPGPGFTFSKRVGWYSGSLANFGIAGFFYGVGHWTGNERARNTGLLTIRALSNSIIITSGIKFSTQRQRPARGGVPLNEMEGQFFKRGTSFPSGHSANAWAIATVVAGQYRHRRWVPFVSYGLATLVSGSRVGARKHFPSDVVVGSLIGYWIGRHVVTESGTPAPEKRRWQVVPHSTRGGGAALTLFWQP
jgi:membrane-associated phospholipid phosphatase